MMANPDFKASVATGASDTCASPVPLRTPFPDVLASVSYASRAVRARGMSDFWLIAAKS